MAITTLDGVIAGTVPPVDFLKPNVANFEAIGVLHSYAYLAGYPGAAAAPSPGMAGEALTTYDGQIPWSNPGAGNSYLSRFALSSSIAGTGILYDRLWHNSGIAVTTTTAQTVNSVAWPARDRAGTVNGDGVLIGLEVSTAIGQVSVVTTITVDYTNSAGVSGRTATIPSFPSTATLGTFVPFLLQAGDLGVRSIQSITLGTTLTSGAIHLVAYRPLVTLGVLTANVATEVNAITGGFPRLFDNTVPFLLWRPTSITAANLAGTMAVAQG